MEHLAAWLGAYIVLFAASAYGKRTGKWWLVALAWGWTLLAEYDRWATGQFGLAQVAGLTIGAILVLAIPAKPEPAAQ